MTPGHIIRQGQDEIEVEARTAPEAIRVALSRLGLKKSEVDIKILREEHGGLFSMNGQKMAKIKVTRKL